MNTGERHAESQQATTTSSNDSHPDGAPSTTKGIGGVQQKAAKLGITDSAREAFIMGGYKNPGPRMSVKKTKAAVRKRDRHLCRNCGIPDSRHNRNEGRRLDVHRIFPGQDYTLETCVTLCRPCHLTEHRVLRKRKAANPFRVELSADLKMEAALLASESRVSVSEYMQAILTAAIKERYARYQEAKKLAATT